MTVENKPVPQRQKFPLLLSIGLTVVMLGAMSMVIRGCGGEGGVPLIVSHAQYGDMLAEVQKETQAILERADREEPLTDQELKILERVEPKTLGMINFDPTRFPIYLLAAKIAFAEEKYEACVDACTRLFERLPGTSPPQPDEIESSAEAHYVASRAYFKLGRIQESLSEAQQAVRLIPNAPKYWWALGTAQLEAGDESAAALSVNRGQALDPSDKRLQGLAKFIAFETPDSSKDAQRATGKEAGKGKEKPKVKAPVAP